MKASRPCPAITNLPLDDILGMSSSFIKKSLKPPKNAKFEFYKFVKIFPKTY
jgi:hypothetical protein